MTGLLCSIVLIAALSVPAAVPSSHPKAAVAATPADTAKVGAYALEITTDDGTTTGLLAIVRANDRLSAKVTVGDHSPETKSFVHDGDKYVLTAGGNDFSVVYKFTFARDSLHGTFAMIGGPGYSGSVIGALKR